MKIFTLSVIALVVVAAVLRSRKRQKVQQQEYKDAFDSVFAELSAMPNYEQTYSYGYPAFTVTFATESDLEECNSLGLTKRFSEKISELCGGSGSKKHPFDAKRAIWFTYEGQIVKSQHLRE